MRHYFITCSCMLLLTLIHGISFSQEGNVWTFGSNALVDFGTNPPTVGTSSLSSYEGCATMSDNNGDLIFYTNGQSVWDATHALIATGLNGHWSSAQSSMIVPEPGLTPGSATGRYYIFTMPQLGSGLMQYSIYNSTTNSVTTLNHGMQDSATAVATTENVTVARHCNGIDYWVITHEIGAGNTRFKAYRVSNTGVSAPVNTNIGPVTSPVPGGINAACQMKISPDNRRLAFMVRRDNVNLFDFNPSTGVISNHVTVAGPAPNGYYGVEFSPNSEVLYYDDIFSGIFAYDILSPATRALITVPGTTTNLYAALQLAPNGLIYVAKDGDSNMGNLNQTFLGVIDDPNNYLGSSYTANGLELDSGTSVKCGLPNIIPSISSPLLTIKGYDTLCLGTSTTLTATGGSDYVWSPDYELNTTTGPVVVASPQVDTTYTVLDSIDGCVATRQITISVREDCCFAETDSVFTQITSDVTFDFYTILSGKYFVADDVIITVDAATLDMTNVDMVFGECAGINFINNAEAIAYNSVFRTCDETQSWLGFSFNGSHGTISESTFKNAQKALNLDPLSDVRIINNNFLNNQISVMLNNTALTQTISGNEFTVNQINVNYQTCENTYSNNDAFAILGIRANLRDVVSQNNFVNADFNNMKRVYGIYFTESSSSANISANTFTNQFTSIYISQGSRITMQNNTIELTPMYSYPGLPGEDIQIYVLHSSTNCVISGNTLKGRQFYSNYGIFCEASSRISITGNNLKNFRTCIQTLKSTTIDIISNTIENCGTGIYSSDSKQSYFGCNVINCLEDNSTGIWFDQTFNTQSSTRIVGNCIYNTYSAIVLNKSATTGAGTIPLIVNNFLYGYRNYGVRNINFNGPIGTGLTGTTAGKNTFSSNNVGGGAQDISSTTPLTSVGNYGVTNVNANVTLSGNNVYYSTTACGGQLGNANTVFSSNDLCQNVGNQGIMQAVIGNGTLNSDFAAQLDELAPEEKVMTLLHVASALAAPANTTDMDDLQAYVLSTDLTTNNKNLVLSKLYTEQPSIALELLSAIQGLPEFVTVEKIKLAALNNELNDTQIAELMAIQDGESAAREKAREVLNTHLGRFPYRLEKSSTALPSDDQTGISVSQNDLTIFPNPASETVSLQLIIPSNVNSTLVVTDLSGKVIMNSTFSEDFRIIDLDISALSNGMYMVSVLQNNTLLLSKKLSVLH